MVDIIGYLKSLVFPSQDLTRKRRAVVEDYDIPLKMRKTRTSPFSSSSEEDWISTSSSGITRNRNTLLNSNANPLWSKENSQVIIDDDDISEIAMKSKHDLRKNFNTTFGKSHTTSTPKMNFSINGHSNDDLTYLKATQTIGQKKSDAKKQSFEYVKPFSYLDDNKPKKTYLHNGMKIKDLSIPIFKRANEVRNMLGLKRHQRSTLMDQTYRLDEKMKYQELLASRSSNTKLPDSFSKYSTPSNKLFAFGTSTSRGTKMVEMSTASTKPSSFIDLTGGSNNGAKTKPTISTRDTIEKVLNDFDLETIVIKDSDSDIEILPTPPSPKPDIKVPRVNSFQPIVNSVEPSHEEWLQNLIQTHRKRVTNYEREISAKAAQTVKLKEINSEIHTQRLGDQLAKYLHIKEAVLPIRIDEEAVFPPLTEEDELLIDNALNRKFNPNEVLASKFNLNITRRDILTLAGLNWLNDEVINFYMNLIIERGKLSRWPNSYAMNTFFYPKLLKDGYNSLKRWTRRVDIFSYDMVAIPIHLGVHWCMSIIDFRDRRIRYFDSMGSTNRKCLDALRMYLEEEHLDKKKSKYDTSQWKLENAANIPNQMNGSDCGMFACTFAEFLTRNVKITFTQTDMPYLRRKMALEILRGELLMQ